MMPKIKDPDIKKNNEERVNEIIDQAVILPDDCVDEIIKRKYHDLFLIKKIMDLNYLVSPHAVVEFIAKTGEVLNDSGYGKVWIEISNHQQKFVKSQKDVKIIQGFIGSFDTIQQ